MDRAKRDRRIAAFWQRYLAICQASGVPAASRPWYRRRVEAYLSAYPGVRLGAHTPTMVEAYLRDIGHSGMPGWQYRQAVDALRLLFSRLMATAWCDGIDWDGWKAWPGQRGPVRVLPGRRSWMPSDEKG